MPEIVIRKTRNYRLIERLDTKIFGEKETEDDPIESCVWWLIIVDGKVAGFAGWSSFVEEGKKCGFLNRAGLLAPYRGHGIQKVMIRKRTEAAKRAGCWVCYTYTAEDNCASSNSLIRCGYKLYTPAKSYGLKHALYWRKVFKGG